MYHAPRQSRRTNQNTHQPFLTFSWHMQKPSFQSTAGRGLPGVNQGTGAHGFKRASTSRATRVAAAQPCPATSRGRERPSVIACGRARLSLGSGQAVYRDRGRPWVGADLRNLSCATEMGRSTAARALPHEPQPARFVCTTARDVRRRGSLLWRL